MFVMSCCACLLLCCLCLFLVRTTLSWWFCRVFAWRPFASPGKETTNSSRKRNAWNVAYFRVSGRKVAMRKHEKVTNWRVFAWRPFRIFAPVCRIFAWRGEWSPRENTPNGDFFVFLRGDLSMKSTIAEIKKTSKFVTFCIITFKPLNVDT